MPLKPKIKEYKEHFQKTYRSLSRLSFSDMAQIYRKSLKRVPDILHLKNVVLFSGLATLLMLVLFSQRFSALADYLPKIPEKGGIYSEGMIGTIEQLNPLFSPTNSSEQAAVSLIFSGLTKRNNNRESIPDLAERWEVSKDGKTYTFFLKDNLKWQDGENLTADDILFTFETIQNPDAASPLLETWKGVDISKGEGDTIVFELNIPYSGFIANTDVPILPKHILEDIPVGSLKTAEFGTKPIGSGPYAFSSLKKVKDSTELTLTENTDYYGKEPYIPKVVLWTYPDFPKLTEAYTKKEVLAISQLPVSELRKNNQLPNIDTYNLAIPTYNTAYFNLRSGIGKVKSFREAVSLAVDRSEIVSKVYDGRAFPIYGPILPGYPGYTPSLKYKRNLKSAAAKLKAAGFKLGKDGVYAKGKLRAEARLVVQDDYLRMQTAEIIKEDCKAAGINIEIEKYPSGTFFQDYVRPRNFDIIIISQNLGTSSDLYAFWHSTQTNDPGLNFSGISNRKLDKYMEEARVALNLKAENMWSQAAAEVITQEKAALYLVWPDYVFGLSKEVHGFEKGRFAEPKDHFWNITDWYLKDSAGVK